LLDVSEVGFAVMADTPHAIDDVVRVRIRHDGVEYVGNARIKSTREIWEGRYRYGLYCLFERDDAGTLPHGLAEISKSYDEAG
jgi:hypothetical protein